MCGYQKMIRKYFGVLVGCNDQPNMFDFGIFGYNQSDHFSVS